MCSLGNECVEKLNTSFLQDRRSRRKKNVGVITTGLVRNDGQNSCAGLDTRECIFNNLAKLIGRQICLRRSEPDSSDSSIIGNDTVQLFCINYLLATCFEARAGL